MLGKKRNETINSFSSTPQPTIEKKSNETTSDENDIFDIVEELSSEKILEKQEKVKELSKQLKEIEREKEEINKELNKGNKFKELQESFNKSKNEFVFKVTYDNYVFY